MPIAIPQEHREVTIIGITKQLVCQTACVTKLESWSETHVSGGGNHGTRHSSPVTSTVTKKDKIFAMDENGREHSWTFSNSGINAREGHALTLVSFVSKKPSSFIMVYNHNLSQWTTLSHGLDQGLRVNRWWLVPSWILVVVGAGLGFVPLLGMYGLKKARARKFRAVAADLASAFAVQEPKFPGRATG